MLPQKFPALDSKKRRFSGGPSVPSQDGDSTSQATLSHSRSNCGVPTCVDQRETRFTSIPIERSQESPSRSRLGLSDLQHSAVDATGLEAKPSSRGITGSKDAAKTANNPGFGQSGLFFAFSVKRFRCAADSSFIGSADERNFSGVLEVRSEPSTLNSFADSFTPS